MAKEAGEEGDFKLDKSDYPRDLSSPENTQIKNFLDDFFRE